MGLVVWWQCGNEMGCGMSRQVLVDLPEEIYRRVESLARLTSREVGAVLAEAIAVSFTSVGAPQENDPTMASLSDREVMELTQLQLPRQQDRRLSVLLDRQQARSLSEAERTELQELMLRYQRGLLRKAEALHEAVRRGLRDSLEP